MEQKLSKKQQKELVQEVWKDFKKREQERKPFELNWQLNINFLMGNQYCFINSNNILKEADKQYFWEEREVFNHIAPLVETRLSRLAEVKPSMLVLPASSDEEDIGNAKVCKDILQSVSSKIDLSKLISQATSWSEVCGTGFYKIVWNSSKGSVIGLTDLGEKIYEGDVDVMVCSPFEIYPDSNSSSDISECKSIIYAKSYDVDVIEKIWGVKLEGSDIDSYALSSFYDKGLENGFSKVAKTTKHNQAMIIEKYELPTKDYPDGRLIIVAKDTLLYNDKLPYKNMQNGERGYPFVRQVSITQPSLFWGSSVIDRLIPIQRAYNTIKNRKHEFMNRLSMGVLMVEDGSVDVDALSEDGLAPGKILVYRQGSEKPKMMSDDAVPNSFSEEEEKLLKEFTSIGGINDIFSGSNLASMAHMSGVAIQLLIEQEYFRISASGESLKFAVKQVEEQILRLYKQFVQGERVSRLVGNNGVSNFFYWNKGNISSDEVVFDTQSENIRSLSQQRNMVLDLLKEGVFYDKDGKLSDEMRLKILDMLGFGLWEEGLDENSLQMQKAKRENILLASKGEKPTVELIHNHKMHINIHSSFMLTTDFEKLEKQNPELKQIMIEHIQKHKNLLEEEQKKSKQEGEKNE
ncbi:MAG: hypothetical protein IJ837_02105 [Clostridia bacterium]|nr:hypothetical protein [Clostridia bacterium]